MQTDVRRVLQNMTAAQIEGVVLGICTAQKMTAYTQLCSTPATKRAYTCRVCAANGIPGQSHKANGNACPSSRSLVAAVPMKQSRAYTCRVCAAAGIPGQSHKANSRTCPFNTGVL